MATPFLFPSLEPGPGFSPSPLPGLLRSSPSLGPALLFYGSLVQVSHVPMSLSAHCLVQPIFKTSRETLGYFLNISPGYF